MQLIKNVFLVSPAVRKSEVGVPKNPNARDFVDGDDCSALRLTETVAGESSGATHDVEGCCGGESVAHDPDLSSLGRVSWADVDEEVREDGLELNGVINSQRNVDFFSALTCGKGETESAATQNQQSKQESNGKLSPRGNLRVDEGVEDESLVGGSEKWQMVGRRSGSHRMREDSPVLDVSSRFSPLNDSAELDLGEVELIEALSSILVLGMGAVT
ncbi:hypothetical protein Dimus_017152 [Dionaea muscipula]